MNKVDKITICFLLIGIIFFSAILVFKVNAQNKYDEELYSEIYEEFNDSFSNISDLKNEKISVGNIEKKEQQSRYYRVIGCITIAKLGISYPVIAQTTEEYLKVAPCKFWGGEPNQAGNLSIIGHNYKNSDFFSKIDRLEIGDIVNLQDKSGKCLNYKVFDKYEVSDNDFCCTEQNTNGTIDLTLITCAKSKAKRFVVKCRANG